MQSIQAPLLLHYAGLDQRVNAGIAAYEAALKADDKRYTIYIYPNVNHAFNNDTSRPLRQAGGGSRLEPHHRLLQGEPWRAAEGRLKKRVVRRARRARMPAMAAEAAGRRTTWRTQSRR